jgi:hypothetical protein
MLPFGVTVLATVLQKSEIPEGIMNYPVFIGEKKFKKEIVEENAHAFYPISLL